MKMYLKRGFIIAFAIILTMVIQSCNNDNDTLTATNSARVQLKLVDAPGMNITQVNINIVDIQYNNSDNETGWTSLTNNPISVDLTKLIAGNNLLLTDNIIPAGNFKQIRLILGSGNTLQLEGSDALIPLDTPSAMQSGLKLQLNANLEAGFSYTFILDWDVQKSIVQAGTSGKYNLKPVISVNAEVNSGSVSGVVVKTANDIDTPMDGLVVEFSNNSDALINGTTLTDKDGKFLIQGLKAGTYTLTINKEGYVSYSKIDVSVTAGNITNIDKITLVPTITTP